MCQVCAATTGRFQIPKDQGIDSVRQTRDEIKRRVLQLLEQERMSNGLAY